MPGPPNPQLNPSPPFAASPNDESDEDLDIDPEAVGYEMLDAAADNDGDEEPQGEGLSDANGWHTLSEGPWNHSGGLGLGGSSGGVIPVEDSSPPAGGTSETLRSHQGGTQAEPSAGPATRTAAAAPSAQTLEQALPALAQRGASNPTPWPRGPEPLDSGPQLGPPLRGSGSPGSLREGEASNHRRTQEADSHVGQLPNGASSTGIPEGGDLQEAPREPPGEASNHSMAQEGSSLEGQQPEQEQQQYYIGTAREGQEDEGDTPQYNNNNINNNINNNNNNTSSQPPAEEEEDSMEMTAERRTAILGAMKNFSLPYFPTWAVHVPEEQWVGALRTHAELTQPECSPPPPPQQ